MSVVVQVQHNLVALAVGLDCGDGVEHRRRFVWGIGVRRKSSGRLARVLDGVLGALLGDVAMCKVDRPFDADLLFLELAVVVEVLQMAAAAA